MVVITSPFASSPILKHFSCLGIKRVKSWRTDAALSYMQLNLGENIKPNEQTIKQNITIVCITRSIE